MHELLKDRRIYLVYQDTVRMPYKWCIADIPHEEAMKQILARFDNPKVFMNGVLVWDRNRAKVGAKLKRIIDTKTNEVYDSIAICSKETGFHRSYISIQVNKKVTHPRFKVA